QERVRRTAQRYDTDEPDGDSDEGDVHDGVANGDQSSGELHRAVGDVRVDDENTEDGERSDSGDCRVEQRSPVTSGGALADEPQQSADDQRVHAEVEGIG